MLSEMHFTGTWRDYQARVLEEMGPGTGSIRPALKVGEIAEPDGHAVRLSKPHSFSTNLFPE